MLFLMRIMYNFSIYSLLLHVRIELFPQPPPTPPQKEAIDTYFRTSTSGTPLASLTTRRSSSTYVTYRSRLYWAAWGRSTLLPSTVALSYVSVRRREEPESRRARTATSFWAPPRTLTGMRASMRGCSLEMAAEGK